MSRPHGVGASWSVWVSESADDLELALLTASRALVAIAARSLADVSSEITLPQYRALVVLASRGPLPVGDLADRLDLAPSTVTRLCDRLVEKGLIARVRGEERADRRRVEIRLAPAGHELVTRVTARRAREIGRLVATIPPELHDALTAAFRAFADAADEIPDRDWPAAWPV